MSADPKAAPTGTDMPPATPTSEQAQPAVESVPETTETKPQTATEVASSAASQAAGAAAAAGAAVQSAANTARTRAQQHGFYQGNIEEELGQVVKSLGSFWGGFKARSASTFTTLKADAEKGFAQVQNDLKQLQDTKVEVGVKEKEEWEREQEEERKKKAEREMREANQSEEREREAASKDKGKGRALPEDETSRADPTSPTSAFFSRLTSSTSTLQATLQSTLTSTLAAAKANPALSNPTQLRDQLAENLRLSSARENLTMSLRQAEALAEDYLKKGGEWARSAEQAAEKWVEENVKVVPPQGVGASLAMGAWDAGELYSFSTMVPDEQKAPVAEDGRTPRASLSSAAVAGSRKEALLSRLREDKELLLPDPGGEAETQQRRDEFAAWVRDIWPTAQTAGREAEVGNVGVIRMALVPEHLTDEQFWQRYLFHKDMIEAADKKRKALLEASAADDGADDFNWDDDDDDDEQPAPSAKTAKTESPAPSAPSSSATPKPPAEAKSPPATSPRDSEESYDVVNASTATPTEDSDSDWE
ncbi:hypothetical protein CspeluHIS016_0308010 [Cutaneotrichosporon spelunceum]|uniref:BSD domain-containing protein n=1 Tax=Cutaneotrichosporon spelunceum TaxID=1672016 RepID=A0AAD3YBF8_9TREE|nr:hypothetical protein CspeluHIS016_0308010 [Cutaneotrichosporon spelunceum]